MDREQLENYILETYNVSADCPWTKYPNFKVFRHANNQKWFALIMEVSKEKLGAPGDGVLDVVNLKCDPIMIGSLRCEKGFFPAYHMNKGSWITVSLDGSVADEKIKLLLDMSYDATAGKVNKMDPVLAIKDLKGIHSQKQKGNTADEIDDGGKQQCSEK